MVIEFVETTLSVDDIRKVAATDTGNMLVGEGWVWDMLALPSGERPRVYAYLEPLPGEAHGQRVKLTSHETVTRYAGRISFAWTSTHTVRDIVRNAGASVR